MNNQSIKNHIRLVGDVLVNTTDSEYRWFAEAYHRMTSEVKQAGEVLHLVRYETDRLQFFGVEVEHNTPLPHGLCCWELGPETWTIRDSNGNMIWQTPLNWQWRDISNAGRSLGEFTALCPLDWSGGQCEFQVTANSYVKQDEPCNDEVELVESNPDWPRQYKEFAAWLQDELGLQVALSIEHYGSTSIPGIPAKPIIDVLVEVPSFAMVRQQILPLLNREEWEYWWYNDHMAFIKREKLMGRRTHHVHIAPAGHRLWEGLAFRDYLIAHPEVAARYAELKLQLAQEYREDREKYTQAKTDFVREITAKALRYAAEHGEN